MNEALLQKIEQQVSDGNVDELSRLFRKHPKLVNAHFGADTWLHMAAQEGQLEVTRLLFDLGADPNIKQDGFPAVPLRHAMIDNHVEVAKLLLERGARPDIEGIVVSAVVNDKPRALEMVKLLDKFGADLHETYINEYTKEPMNALSAAIEAGNQEVIDYLQSRGCVLPTQSPPKQKSWEGGNEVVEFFQEHFGPVHKKSLIEIVPTEPSIAIHVIPAGNDRQHVTLFTTGMSDHAMKVPKANNEYRFAELFIQLPAKWPLSKEKLADPNYYWPIHWLRWVAKYPHQNDTWLGGPATIIAEEDPPRPFAPKIKFTSMLALVEREFTGKDGRTIKLYRLTPLYTEERNLEIKKGIEALLKAFDKHEVSFVVDLNRRSVVAR